MSPRRDASALPPLLLELPAWIADVVRPGDVVEGRDARMRLAIRLASENVARRTGGPFGAVVLGRNTGRVVAVGVNIVVPSRCSLAHAEAMALALAQQAAGSHDLSAPGLPAMVLAASAQPCCQCFGIIWWSGILALEIGARAEDVESIAGFREGPLPNDWAEQLRLRSGLSPIALECDVLRDEALAPLRAFRQSGQPAYDPGGES